MDEPEEINDYGTKINKKQRSIEKDLVIWSFLQTNSEVRNTPYESRNIR